MPELILEALSKEAQQRLVEYRPGYDWIPGRFGPPPGIPHTKKMEFDRLADRDYLYAFMRLSQEEKESLMISEAERRRTFAAHWPIEHIVKGNDVAKEGLYYTGIADKVQCAFCNGIIRNWEQGDVPSQAHRSYFSYCKMVLRKPCFNIPYDSSDILKDIVSDKLQLHQQTGISNISELGICHNKPSNHAYSILRKRVETFASYNVCNPIPAERLSESGFYYNGYGDRVTCFWCKGSLENWEKEDDPWTEHAKWYPGCTYLKQVKGVDFIRKARAKMTKEDIDTSNGLEYNKDDLSFLEDVAEKPVVTDIQSLFTYRLCVRLGLEEVLVYKAFELNGGNDYDNPQSVISVVYILEGNGSDAAEKIKPFLSDKSQEVSAKDNAFPVDKETEISKSINDIIKKQDNLTEEESTALLEVMTCEICHTNPIGAVFLPCGHFILCQPCSYRDLPSRCVCCDSAVKATCRLFLC